MAEPPKKKNGVVTKEIKLQIPAGKANPSPPIGPALGQAGVAIMDFCKAFNDQTKNHKPGTVLPVVISVYKDRSFTFVIKTPPASYLLKEILGLAKGSPTPHSEKVGKITRAQLEEVAKMKMPDLTAASMQTAIRTIAGSARSMGIDVVDGV